MVASINFAFSLVIFYYTPLFELALTTHTGHVFMIIHFLLAGYLFAMVLVGTDPGPRKWAPSLRLVILFVTISFHAFFGVAMQSTNTLLAGGFFERIAVPRVPDVLAARPDAQVLIVGGNEVSYGGPPKEGTWKDIFLDEVKDRLDLSRVHFIGKVPYPAFVSIMPPGSEPDPGCGSVITKEDRIWPSTIGCSQRSFCASVFSTLFSTFMLPSSGAQQLKASGPKIERLASS